jgi:endonuclease/exonuclease/phosphatase family metal-dependent hydrolase
LSHRTPLTRARLAAILGLMAGLAAMLAAPAADAAKKKPVKVMTRNLYLGADLGPGLSASNFQELADGSGVVVNQVDANDFSTRAKGLAAEIRKKDPHLVGLQEAAWWRRKDPCGNPLPPTATDDYSAENGNFLKQLLAQLNKGRKRYRAVVVQNEFDFETFVNYDGDEGTGTDIPGVVNGCDFNGRLTMRDVILAKKGVKTSNEKSGNFETLLQVSVGGIPINVTRGWTSVNAKVKRAPKFRFVNTHFEAFDNQLSNHTNQGTDVGNGEVREAQAAELIADGGPATGKLPIVLLGDLNSGVDSPLKPGDELANQLLLDNGFKERSTRDPFSCCLSADVLTEGGGGSIADFDHNVDHVMTGTPKKVKLLSSAVTGRQPVNGYWSSDHAGIFSKLKVK